MLAGGCVAQLPDTLMSAAAPATPADAPLPLPRDRTGCLPFPGLFTLYAEADPARLGDHHYARGAPSGVAEEERGIFYTAKAGFLDLAHVRNTIDWTRYCVAQFAAALARHDTTLTFNGTNGSLVHVTLSYPDDGIHADDRHREQFDLALRLGERTAYVLLNWHEAASWFGDHTFLFDESPSAFTWDDVMSHVIGVRVAELALCSDGWTFDRAVTFYLDQQVRSLGAVGPSQTRQAVDAVDGTFWAHGRPLRRQTDTGFETGAVTPWLVAGLPFSDDARPQPFAVPDVLTSTGLKLAERCRVQIEPRCAAAERMRAVLPARPEWFDVDHDLPVILAEMRREMGEPAVGR